LPTLTTFLTGRKISLPNFKAAVPFSVNGSIESQPSLAAAIFQNHATIQILICFVHSLVNPFQNRKKICS
jgi:hypothetical protein